MDNKTGLRLKQRQRYPNMFKYFINIDNNQLIKKETILHSSIIFNETFALP